jgi:hypothetical protein
VSLRRVTRFLDRSAAHLATWPGRLVLFAVAVGVYEIASVATPLRPGRDLGNYLHYYLQLGDSHPPLLLTMVYREPVAPLLLGGSLDLGGGPLAEACMAILYAGSIVAWTWVAGTFARRAALFTAVALLVFPGYAILFHEYSSDAVFAAGYAGWAVLMARAALRPTAARFALVGLGVGVLTLIRPGNEVLLAFGLFAFLVGTGWGRRLRWLGAFLLSAAVVLGGWTAYNGARYGVYAVSRGGNAYIPFFRAFVKDHIVSPDNGPASRELALAVATRLLPLQPYRAYGITLNEFFASGSVRMHEDLIHLSDLVWGWDSNYTKLRAAGMEAVEKHPGRYVRGVASTVGDEFWYPLFAAGAAAAAAPVTAPRKPKAGGGRRLPVPTEGEPIPASHYTNNTTTPEGTIHDVWTSPTEHHLVYPTRSQQRSYQALLARTASLEAPIVGDGGNATLRHRLDQASKWYPRLAIWLVVGLVALLIRRPRRARLAVALAASGLLVVVFAALGISEVIEFVVPVAPAFVVLAAVGLLGDTRPAATSAAGP